ncbi:MAG: hypothetical protein E7499_01795 [Ruminococcus sp.]|nr:hypothetical protein [Ruminococcus sp.]
MPLAIFFYFFNFITVSWYVEEKDLTNDFYLFDYMVDNMERGRAVDLYFNMCDLSFFGINPFIVRPIAVIISLMLIFITYNDVKSKKKAVIKWIFYALIVVSVMFIAFIAFPFAEQSFLDDCASI